MAQKPLSLWLYMALASVTHLSAQSFHFDRIGAAEGLSQGMVYDLMQCSSGFLWVATKDGLSRYDGYGFQVFQHDSFNPFTLSDNEVKAVMEDSQGRIWAGTLLSGLNVLDPRTGRAYQIEGLPSLQVNAIAEAPDGAVWVGTEAGVNRIRLPEKLPSDTPKLSAAAVQSEAILWAPGAYAKAYAVVDIAFDAKGTAWVSTNEYLGIFDADAQQFKVVWKNAAPPDKEVVTSFFKPTADGTVWAGQLDKLLRFREGKADVFLLPRRSPNPYVDMAFDAAGDMYVSNRKYIFKFKQPDKARPGSADIETIYRFPENGIMGTTKLLIDRSGLLWAGTNGYGLLKHNPGNPHFHHYLAGKSPRRIHVDRQNRVWVWNSGSKFGLLDKKNNVAQATLLTDPQYHQHDCASTPDGALWVLCESMLAKSKKNGALIKLDAHSLKVLAKYPLPIDVGMFGRLFSDTKGNLWALGAKSTLLRFDPNTVETEVHDFSAATGFSELALSFHIGQDGHYWIGTPHGLLRATPKGGGLSYERFVNNPNDPNSLSCNFILCAIDDPLAPERYCWVGTKGGGISRLDKITGHFKNYTTAEGLPNNVVYGILPETSPSGAPALFWFSTNRGLSRFDPNSGLCQNYFSTDGLQDNEFNTISFAKAADGQLYFGGVNGITAFYPSQVKSANRAAEVQLTNLLVNNKPLLPLGIALHDRILQLQHLQNQLTFNFAAIDFAAPQMNQYRYRLMGVDRDWVESTTKNSATYAHLNPGKYVFEVITGGSRGVWNHNAARLTVQILPPWWKTGWACAIYSVLAALGAWSFYRFQMNRVRLKNKLKYEQKEAARLIEIDKLKTDFFSSITHELRTPITLLLEPARQLLHETNDKSARFRLELIEGNAKRLLHFVNQMLDLSKLDAGQLPINLKAGNPVSAAKAVFAQFHPLAEQRGIRFSAQWPPETYLVNYDEGKWGQIVSNLLSNAIKFTSDGGQVSLKMRSSASDAYSHIDYELTVTDNGAGVAPEDLPKIFDRFYQTKHNMGGTGIGLALCKELVERMGGSIRAESVLGKGSAFTANIRCERCTAAPAADIPADEPQESVPALLVSPQSIVQTVAQPEAPLILLIEDNSDMRQFLRESMPKGYRIAEASEGAEGIEMALNLVPDLVISDLVMLQKNGFEVVEALKNSSATSHVPIILLTGQSGQESKLKGLRYGADIYLTKPFDSDELTAHIENLLASRKRLQAYFSQESPVTSTVKQLSSPENEFLQKLIQLIEENLDNDDMDAEAFAKAMFVSRSQLHRKISALTGLSLTEFVRNHRLDRAKEMLARNEGSVLEIAWRVGFRNAKYFSTSFKERFGQTPSSVTPKGA